MKKAEPASHVFKLKKSRRGKHIKKSTHKPVLKPLRLFKPFLCGRASVGSLPSGRSHKITPVQTPQAVPETHPRLPVLLPRSSQLDCKPSFPMTPQEASAHLKKAAIGFDSVELASYKRIWYLPVRNFFPTRNYDDLSGYYKLYLGDHIAYRYEVISFLGRGSFGCVCRCFDHKLYEEVAIKIIKNKPEYYDQGLVEVHILEELQLHDPQDTQYFVKLKNYFWFRSHICMAFELLGFSLHSLVSQHEGLPLHKIRLLARQLLVALEFFKKHKVVHCDLKPENILLMPDRQELKVIDFGLGCFLNEQTLFYVQSRFYRAPEVLLGIGYSTAIDMWSFGCILAEMYMGSPLFPCSSGQDLLKQLIEGIGAPPPEMLFEARHKEVCTIEYDQASTGEVRFTETGLLRRLSCCPCPEFVDLVLGCLKWDPECRFTPAQALKHPFMTEPALLPKASPRWRTRSV